MSFERLGEVTRRITNRLAPVTYTAGTAQPANESPRLIQRSVRHERSG